MLESHSRPNHFLKIIVPKVSMPQNFINSIRLQLQDIKLLPESVLAQLIT